MTFLLSSFSLFFLLCSVFCMEECKRGTKLPACVTKCGRYDCLANFQMHLYYATPCNGKRNFIRICHQNLQSIHLKVLKVRQQNQIDTLYKAIKPRGLHLDDDQGRIDTKFVKKANPTNLMTTKYKPNSRYTFIVMASEPKVMRYFRDGYYTFEVKDPQKAEKYAGLTDENWREPKYGFNNDELEYDMFKTFELAGINELVKTYNWDDETTGNGHTSLCTQTEFDALSKQGKKLLLYAGFFITDKSGKIVEWSNGSGHFQPLDKWADDFAAFWGMSGVKFGDYDDYQNTPLLPPAHYHNKRYYNYYDHYRQPDNGIYNNYYFKPDDDAPFGTGILMMIGFEMTVIIAMIGIISCMVGICFGFIAGKMYSSKKNNKDVVVSMD